MNIIQAESWRAARSRLTAPNGGRQLRSAVSCHCEPGGLEGREMGSDYRWTGNPCSPHFLHQDDPRMHPDLIPEPDYF
ncbi:hypothetical protein AMECASPLE_017112 [Ameca splendens]|uniref:Uncharacterized protein n=1 Tax=Ameca splendens TaxID=208324 RepID=A0ABV0XR74_9TELE